MKSTDEVNEERQRILDNIEFNLILARYQMILSAFIALFVFSLVYAFASGLWVILFGSIAFFVILIISLRKLQIELRNLTTSMKKRWCIQDNINDGLYYQKLKRQKRNIEKAIAISLALSPLAYALLADKIPSPLMLAVGISFSICAFSQSVPLSQITTQFHKFGMHLFKKCLLWLTFMESPSLAPLRL